MPDTPSPLRDHARSIWQAAVDAVLPGPLIRAALTDPARPLRGMLERGWRWTQEGVQINA